MTWTLTQNGDSVSGPVLVLLPSGTVLMNGVLAGTLVGTQLAYTIRVPAGGIPTNPNCTGQLSGSATTSISAVSTLTGSYALMATTCPTPFSTGDFALTKTP